MKHWWLAGLLAAVILSLSASPALALGLNDDKVVFDDFTLPAGAVIEGTLVVMGGDTTIEAGARIEGDLVVFGGDVDLAGQVDQDVVLFGGDLRLRETAVVAQNLVRSGGSWQGDEGYEVQGTETQGFDIPDAVVVPDAPEPPAWSWPFNGLIGFIWEAISAVTSAVVAGLLALVVMLLMPEQVGRVSGAIAAAPLMAGGVGLLTLIAVPFLAVVLAVVTLLCFSPVSLIALLVYAIAILFGWLAVGALLGERLAASLRLQALSPALAAGVGTLLLTLVVNGIGILPMMDLLTFPATVVIGAVGLGAVVLTRFGARPFINAPAAPPPLADSAPAAD